MNRLKAHINQRVPVKELPIIKEILNYECQLEVVKFVRLRIEINPYYFKCFLKLYISEIELVQEETSDELYELFVDPQILNSKELDVDVSEIISYNVGGFYTGGDGDGDGDCKKNTQTILVEETPKLISGNNTTGLRTWEAALYLANCLQDSAIVNSLLPSGLDQSKTILELGCGTGLLGLSLAKTQKIYNSGTKTPSKIIMTDGSMAVFENSHSMLSLNSIDSSLVQFRQLIWGEDLALAENVDVVVGADITYDSRILEPLCKTIDDLFRNHGLQTALISATIRNAKTIESWEKELNTWFEKRWNVPVVEKQPGNIKSACYFGTNTPEIRIYRITR
ncbi:hypothetical protein PP707_08090 [Acetobacter pasteurianus]|nr:hypothetical protein [Acetobacter pasteurianus]